MKSLNMSRVGIPLSCAIAAAGLGWGWMMVEGFSCTVGDPPYEQGCPDIDFRLVWLKSSVYVFVVLYAIYYFALVASYAIGKAARALAKSRRQQSTPRNEPKVH